MGLFQMQETSSTLIAMIILVVLVDSLSYLSRRVMSR
jgi:ABC-type phosphate/phosphonate transport system permease subunit